MQLQPELSAAQTANSLISRVGWEINSQDLRIEQYLIEITNGKNAASLINESQSSRLIIENALQQQWHKRGLIFKTQSENKIDVQLIKLLAKVEQNTLSHNIDSQIVIRIKLTTKNKIISKTFTSNLSKEGVFSADPGEVSKELNTQLSQLLTEIIQDQELNTRLQQL
jgi:uncharacterized lipoprotein